MNVLITSAGRRGSLVRIFQETLRARAPDAAVYAVDAQPQLSAACHLADGSFAAPRVTSPEYVPLLIDLCREKQIRLVVPTIDPELTRLALARDQFAAEGIHVAVSSAEVCETFRWKRSTARFFAEQGFSAPPIIEDLGQAHFPLFAKLDNSSCSIGAQRVEDLVTARQLLARNEEYIFQSLLCGTEFTVDAFVDGRGQVIDCVPRRRLEVRAGEVSKAVAERDVEIQDAVVRLCRAIPGAYGVLTVQVFRTDEGLQFVEVNPRFGGGFPLTYHAGANMVDYLLRDMQGEQLAWQDQWRDGTMMLRYDAEVIAHGDRV